MGISLSVLREESRLFSSELLLVHPLLQFSSYLYLIIESVCEQKREGGGGRKIE